MAKKNEKIGLLDFEKADLTIARTHHVIPKQKASKVRRLADLLENEKDHICPCCSLPTNAPQFSLSCNISELSELGVGFPLFFYFTKSVIFLTFFAGLVVGIACIYSNMQANNISPISVQPASWYESAFISKDNKLPLWQTLLHGGYCIFMILYMFVLKRYLKRKTQAFDMDATTPSDFTVWVKNLPVDYKVEELKKFLMRRAVRGNQNVEISVVTPVYDITYYVKQVRELEQLKGALSYTEDYRKKYRKHPAAPCCNSRKYSIKHLKERIKNINNWLEKFETVHKRVFSTSNSVFVTFRSQDISKQCMKYWRKTICDHIALILFKPILCCCCCCFTRWKFHGKILSIVRAPEPSDLIWENLSVSLWAKRLRKLVTILCTLVLLLVLCFILFQVKTFQYKIHEGLGNGTESVWRVRSMSILMSLIIISVGRVIAISVRLFSAFEKHFSWTGYHMAVANKLIFATSLNSIAILLIVNLVAPSHLPSQVPGVERNDNTIPLYQDYGLASDLFWLLVTDSIVSPLTCFLSPLYVAKLLKRRGVKNSAKKGIISITQGEANAIWENPPIDMAQRYANYMKTLLVVFFFAPVFPLGYFIGTISMFLQYWTDKYLLLRRHSRPPQLGGKLSDNIMQWMPILIVCYSVSNFLTYTLFSEQTTDYLQWIPYGVIAFSVVFFILPCKCSCLKSGRKKITRDENDFEIQNLEFVEDYQRCNPVTSRQGWKEWLDQVESKDYVGKKGYEEKINMEQKLKEVIPDQNNSVQQYAIQGGRDSMNFASVFQKNSVLGQRKSTSVLKTFARQSNPGYEPVPEEIDKKFVRQFTKN